jgi:hypothetical protein
VNLDVLTKEQDDLRKQIYDVINEWMRQSKCQEEPEIALGMALGAITEAAANYTATYRFHNRFSDEWSEVCCDVSAKVFHNTHYAHLQQLAQKFGTEELPALN